MTLRLQLLTDGTPYECHCTPSSFTTVSSVEVKDNLIKYNPLLAKYFNRPTTSTQANNRSNSPMCCDRCEGCQRCGGGKNLKKVCSQKQLVKWPRSPRGAQDGSKGIVSPRQNTQRVKEQQPKKLSTDRKDTSMDAEQEKKLRQYYRDLYYGSRYLPDSTFRKYFNRQCFENYGMGNSVDIINANRYKTFNIAPHSGWNMPIDEQTFINSLLRGNSNNYYIRQNMDQKTLSPSGKPYYNNIKLIQDNLNLQKKQKKYSHLKLKNKNNQTPPKPPFQYNQAIRKELAQRIRAQQLRAQQARFSKIHNNPLPQVNSLQHLNNYSNYRQSPQYKKSQQKVAQSPQRLQTKTNLRRLNTDRANRQIREEALPRSPNTLQGQNELKGVSFKVPIKLGHTQFGNERLQGIGTEEWKGNERQGENRRQWGCNCRCQVGCCQCTCCSHILKEKIVERAEQDGSLVRRVLANGLAQVSIELFDEFIMKKES